MISGGYSLGQGVRYALKFAHQLVSVHGQGLKDWCSKTAAGFEHADAVRSGMSHHLIGPTDMSVRRCVGSHMHAALASLSCCRRRPLQDWVCLLASHERFHHTDLIS
jgi:hypothetical protein